MGAIKKTQTIKKYSIQKTLIAFLLIGLVASAASAAPAPNDEIHVSADTLISAKNANYAEFQGNVITTYKGAVLYSNRLKITYKEKGAKPAGNQKGHSGDVEKIIATGNVKIVFEDKTSWSESAVYTKADDCILLTGGNPKVVSGKNTISGETIKINRTTEEVFVNGETKQGQGKSKRVEASFFPEESSPPKTNPAPPSKLKK